ncbi:hypothetical protein NE237_007367 [Protea cynaroides]|uniref:Uncharacterized protein n=1 Tax=Protea cynaroides TaxID=273540 RepID=A0A9Q0KP12_9MAGN|nr:hypothetical protein NE237_007367 [Protea cynaroides]
MAEKQAGIIQNKNLDSFISTDRLSDQEKGLRTDRIEGYSQSSARVPDQVMVPITVSDPTKIQAKISQEAPIRVFNPRVSDFDGRAMHIPWPKMFNAGNTGRVAGAGFATTRSVSEAHGLGVTSHKIKTTDDGRGDDGQPQRRKKRRWIVKEKGKAQLIDVSRMPSSSVFNLKNAEGPSIQQPVLGARSFVQVIGGLPNNNTLPNLVVSGGVTRVVLP